jgi:hypothetical protein
MIVPRRLRTSPHMAPRAPIALRVPAGFRAWSGPLESNGGAGGHSSTAPAVASFKQKSPRRMAPGAGGDFRDLVDLVVKPRRFPPPRDDPDTKLGQDRYQNL